MRIIVSMLLVMWMLNVNAAPKVGEMAPIFDAMDSNGNLHNLEDFRGKYVVLEWFNKDCPFVRKHYNSSNMQSLQTKYTANDVVWLMIVSSAPGKQGYMTAAQANETLVTENAAPTALLLDPEGTIGRLYDARTTPHMYVIDKEGMLAYKGAIDSIRSSRMSDVAKADNYVVAAMDALMAGEAVDPAITPPYGCSVKY